jgi:hypothetical protein
VFEVARYKHISAVNDIKLAAETVVPKELGKGIPAVKGLKRAHIHGNAQVKSEITCGIGCFLWGLPITYLGSGLRESNRSYGDVEQFRVRRS